MEQEFVQERISRGKKAMENVQADYEDAKEALKWKQSNLGFLLTDETFRYLQNEVESCRKTYDTWVETYRELINSSSVRLNPEIINLANLLLGHALMKSPTTIPGFNDNFKNSLINEYHCYDLNFFNGARKCYDVCFPASIVIASHLFRRSNAYIAEALMNIRRRR